MLVKRECAPFLTVLDLFRSCQVLILTLVHSFCPSAKGLHVFVGSEADREALIEVKSSDAPELQKNADAYLASNGDEAVYASVLKLAVEKLGRQQLRKYHYQVSWYNHTNISFQNHSPLLLFELRVLSFAEQQYDSAVLLPVIDELAGIRKFCLIIV